MLVDDEVFARDTMAKFIRKNGFDVCVAGTADEAVGVFKKERPDIVFLDLMLPDLDGDYLFPILKKLNNSLDIYFITGSSFVFPEEKAKELGAAGYLQKPVLFEDLSKLLEEIKLKK